jgi:hypothetical protein
MISIILRINWNIWHICILPQASRRFCIIAIFAEETPASDPPGNPIAANDSHPSADESIAPGVGACIDARPGSAGGAKDVASGVDGKDAVFPPMGERVPSKTFDMVFSPLRFVAVWETGTVPCGTMIAPGDEKTRKND